MHPSEWDGWMLAAFISAGLGLLCFVPAAYSAIRWLKRPLVDTTPMQLEAIRNDIRELTREVRTGFTNIQNSIDRLIEEIRRDRNERGKPS